MTRKAGGSSFLSSSASFGSSVFCCCFSSSSSYGPSVASPHLATTAALLALSIFFSNNLSGIFVTGETLAATECAEVKGAVSATLASGDLSHARVLLSPFKESSRDQRTCAAEVWQHGIASLIVEHRSPKRGSKGSAIFDVVGRAAATAQVSDGTWLTLPRVQELVVAVPVMLQPHRKTTTVVLEQDGFLRAFDMASVLWAPGYFMMLWAATNCEKFRGKRVLELGAGLGGPSIVASLCGAQTVLATEKDLNSLLNIDNNALVNGVSSSLESGLLDWWEDKQIESLIAKHGSFDIILGAGIGPQRWLNRFLWVLNRILGTPSVGEKAVILCQGTGDLNTTSLSSIAANLRGSGPEIEVTSGDEYGLLTRWGDSSEFELIEISLGRRPFSSQSTSTDVAGVEDSESAEL